MSHWAYDAVFYHMYPLGLCGAPHRNNLSDPPRQHLEKLIPWLDHARDLGASAILFGPVMESETHGYDIVDFFKVDRRLGDGSTLARVAEETHARGLKLVLDAVFNHVGRNFRAFRDVLEKGRESRFLDWFHIHFDTRSPLGDPFSYETWNGYYELVKLNQNNPEVRHHIFNVVSAWVRDYRIDGLRLDAANHLDMGFMRDLSDRCRTLKPDFWLMGEVIHGDYSRWLKEGGLDSVTNYRSYKGLYSSYNDANYFEIAHTLRHQYRDYGRDRVNGLFTFADNHDVDRVASRLHDPVHLLPLYCLLFTMPGIPAVYYGSEFGLKGKKAKEDDWPLRPALNLEQLHGNPQFSEFYQAVTRLVHLRRELPALRRGDFQELFLSHRRFIFSRRTPDQWLIAAISAEGKPLEQEVVLPESIDGRLVDRLNPGQQFEIKKGKAQIRLLWPYWARIMEVEIPRHKPW